MNPQAKLSASYSPVSVLAAVIFSALVLWVPELRAQKAELQERVGDLKESMAKNKEALSHYTWEETVTIYLKGEEKMAFRPGFKFPVFETDFGNLGILLGWDLAFPESARSLALDGAELIVVPANWEAPNVEEWKTYLLARAYENAVFVGGANRLGNEYTYSFFGESQLIGPRGELYAQVPRDPETDAPQEGWAVAQIDLDLVKKYREELLLFQARQPGVYRAVVKQY